MMPYCGCAGDRLTAGVCPALLIVALWGLVHVEWMLTDRGLDPSVVLRCCWVLVWMWVGVWMWMGVWSCELSWNAVLGRGGKLGWWVSLGHGWVRGCRCVLVTLYGQRDSLFNLDDHFNIPSWRFCSLFAFPYLTSLTVNFSKITSYCIVFCHDNGRAPGMAMSVGYWNISSIIINFVQTFVTPRGWTLMMLVIPWLFIQHSFRVKCLSTYWIDCLEIWNTNSCSPQD